MKKWIFDRLTEPSTWAGLSSVLVAGLGVSPDLAGAATNAAVGVAGLLAVMLKERNK